MTLQEALDILGLDSLHISLPELKSAYRQKAQQVHPDKGGSSQEFIAVRRAFTTIRDYIVKGNGDSNKSQNQETYQNRRQEHAEESQTEFWKHKYQQIYAQSLRQETKFEEVFGQLKSYESQINRIILIFNSGQKMLSAAWQNLQAKLQKLDEIFEIQSQNIKSKYEKSWLDMLLNRQKLDQYAYIKLNNQLVSEINKQESKLISDYHKEIQAIYQELMNQIYKTLSE